MTQTSLFDAPRARTRPAPKPPSVPYAPHSATSLEAAKAVAPKATDLRTAVLQYLLHCGENGATDLEIASGLNMFLDTSRARRVELTKAGSVIDSGRRRLTPSNRTATVWLAVDALPLPKTIPERQPELAGAAHKYPCRGQAQTASGTTQQEETSCDDFAFSDF